MIGSRQEIARLQSDFYREKYRKMLRWLMMSIFVMFALLLYIIYLILFEPVQKYYGNTTDGKILPMPLNQK